MLTHIFRFSVLVGPINHIKHLLSQERLPFSAIYFSSLGLTLYFSLSVSFLSSPLNSTAMLSCSIGTILSWVLDLWCCTGVSGPSRFYLVSMFSKVVSLIAYVLAYFPGGTQTLRLGGSLALRGAGSLLPR